VPDCSLQMDTAAQGSARPQEETPRKRAAGRREKPVARKDRFLSPLWPTALDDGAFLERLAEARSAACEIRLRAERKAGQLLKETEKAKGARAWYGPRTDAVA
jgi:hypothetical protein